MTHRVVPDDREAIAGLLRQLADHHVGDMIVTTGGTGIAASRRHPGSNPRRDRPGNPGVRGADAQPSDSKTTRFAPSFSAPSPAHAGRILIVNHRAPPQRAVESLDAILDLVPHALDLLHGHTEHKAGSQPPEGI